MWLRDFKKTVQDRKLTFRTGSRLRCLERRARGQGLGGRARPSGCGWGEGYGVTRGATSSEGGGGVTVPVPVPVCRGWDETEKGVGGVW